MREGAILAAKIAASRAVILSLPVTDILVLGSVDFLSVGEFSVAASIVQVGVVVSSAFFVGYYARDAFSEGLDLFRDDHPLIVSLILGALFAFLGIAGGIFYPVSEIGSLVTIGSVGLLPLFIFSYAIARLEVSGRAGAVFWLSVFAAILNAILDIALVLVMTDPGEAVMWASTIVRFSIAIIALWLLSERISLRFQNLHSPTSLFIVSRGIPEAATRAIFVSLMAGSLVVASLLLSNFEMAILGLSLNYMSVLLVCSMSITLAASSSLKITSAGSQVQFVKFGIFGSIILSLIFAFAAPGISLFFVGEAFSLATLVLSMGIIAVLFDSCSNHLIMLLRKVGKHRLPPFVRLLMFPILFSGLMLWENVGAIEFLFLIISGNVLSLVALIVIKLAAPQSFSAEMPTK